MPIIDIQPLLKPIVDIRPINLNPIIRLRLRNRVRQLPARTHLAVQHVHQRIPLLLPAQPGPHDRDDVFVRQHAFENDGPDGVHDDDDGLAGGGLGDGRDEVVAVVPGVEREAVALAAFDDEVALAGVGGDEDEGGFGGRGRAGTRGGVVGCGGDDGGAVGGGAGGEGVEGRDEVLGVGVSVRRVDVVELVEGGWMVGQGLGAG